MRGIAFTAMTLAAWLAIGCGQILGFEDWRAHGEDGDASVGGAGGVSGGGGAIADANAEAAEEAGPSCVPPTPLSICEPVQQCGCPAGQACSFVCDGNARQWKTSCGVSSNGTYLQKCMGDFHCTAGLACVTSACRRMCQSAEDCPEQGAGCLPVFAYDMPMLAPIACPFLNNQQVPGLRVCSDQCDPVQPWLKCGQGRCDPVGNGFSACSAKNGTNECSQGDGGTVMCGNGWTCGGFFPGGDGCVQYCRAGMSDCQGGKTCSQPVDKWLLVGTQEYGICK